MPLTMTYDEWMKDTHSLIKPRSEELKKIDNFIKARNQMETLKALTAWIDSQNKKGQDWHRSVRNQKKAVEKLAAQVGYMANSAKAMTPAEKLADSEAKSLVRSQIRRASAQMFAGRRVIMSNIFLQGVRNRTAKGKQKLLELQMAGKDKEGTQSLHAGRDIAGAASNLNTLRRIANHFEDSINGILHGLYDVQKSEILQFVLGTSAAEFALSCAPLIGTISSGGKMVANIINMLISDYDSIELNDRKGDMRPGDAAAALAAIIRIVDNEVARNQKEAAVRGSACAAKAAMLCAGVPGGSVVGAAEGLMIMLNSLHEVAKQYRQMNAANEKIDAGNIDVTIFNACPILGCYYVLVQGDFTIMNFDLANMGKQNWTQEVLRLKLALEPVKKKAVELIDISSIIIEGMANTQGVYQESMWHKISQPFKNKFGNHASKPGTAMGGFVKEDYKLLGIDSGKYSEKELQFLKMFEPA